MFVLSAIRPPKGEAGYGEAVLLPEQDPFTSVGSAVKLLIWILARECNGQVTVGEAKAIGREVMDAPGRAFKHEGTGFTFRVDPADAAPHACPCCKRLVLPEDHAHAHAEDAYCLGCFTWKRDVPACLPQNSAHDGKEGTDGC